MSDHALAEPSDTQPSDDDQPRVDGRARRWTAHRQARRALLLNAAIELLDEREVGRELLMAEIAERAGVRRPIIYRHFTDRNEVLAALEVEVSQRLMQEILPQLDAHKTIIEIIRDSITVYVRWSQEHPALRTIIDRGSRAEEGVVQQRFSDIAQLVTALVLGAVDGADLQITATQRASVDPLVHGLVEAVVGTVRRWVTLEDPPPATVLVQIASESVWFIMAGHAQSLGFQLQRDQTLTELSPA